MPLIDDKFQPLELPKKHARVLLEPGWRYRVLHGGRNGAKDWSAAAVIIERAVRVPTRVLCTREIQKTIKDSIHQLLCDTIHRLGYTQYFDITERAIKSKCGSNFLFTGLRDLNADNVKSVEGVDICIVGEAQNLTAQSWEILNPTIRKSKSEIWLIYNDQAIGDFVYQLSEVDPPDKMICERVNYTDVPREWVSQEIIDQAEQMKRDNPDRYEHIWLGQPSKGGQFFPEFGPHLCEVPFSLQAIEWNLYGSLDYGDGQGDNASATSFGLWHLDREGRPHRLFSYYKRYQNASTYAREIVAALRTFGHTGGQMPKMVFADPAIQYRSQRTGIGYEPSIMDVFKDYGLAVVPAINSHSGWSVMREYFTKDETGVPRSFYWDGYNDEYEMYIPQARCKKGKSDDADKNSGDGLHIHDDARYAFVSFMNMRSAALVELANAQNALPKAGAGPTAEEIIRDMEHAGKLQGEVF